MRVFHGTNQLPQFENCVITIGSFDGVHLGHKALISNINQIAKDADGESLMVTFDPHPRVVIQGKDCNLKLLNTPTQKQERLKANGLQNLVIIPFTRNFADQTAAEYVENFLWKNFQPQTVVVGYDHHFGKNREGSLELMKRFGKQLGFQVVEISKQEVDDIAVSSSEIRRALEEGHVQEANRLLGYNYTLSGVVIHGEHIGQSIGFPTANLGIEDVYKLIPANGVYAVIVGMDENEYPGMLNIGKRPTFDGQNQTIEVHLFNFDEQIYGKQIDIRLKQFIRKERKFESSEELVAQLWRDKATIQKLLT